MKKVLIFLVACTLLSCNNSDTTGLPIVEKRSFAMATSDFPYANSVAAFNESFALMLQNTDMAMMHFDGGVPWQEALDGTAYPQEFLNSLEFKKSKIPSTHSIYLAVTPIAFERNALAPSLKGAGNEPLLPPWNTYAFDHENVVNAYLNYCKFMIDFFEPDYFAYAVEANMLMNLAPDKWPALASLMQQVYTALKAAYPNLPIFFSIQAGWVYDFRSVQLQKLPDVLPYTDYIAVSAYPFTSEPDPDLLPEDYFSFIADLAPEKPFAIAETTWPAEDLTAPFPVFIPETEERQEAYMNFLLTNMKNLNAKFVAWFLVVDYDQFWETEFADLPNASVLRIWKDSGLYDGNRQPRKAQQRWHDELLKVKE